MGLYPLSFCWNKSGNPSWRATPSLSGVGIGPAPGGARRRHQELL
jgi:hypothetical protein